MIFHHLVITMRKIIMVNGGVVALLSRAVAGSNGGRTHRRLIRTAAPALMVRDSHREAVLQVAAGDRGIKTTFAKKEIRLFELNICPSCNKIRVFLDYYKIPYLYTKMKAEGPVLKVDGEQMLVDESTDDVIIDKLYERIILQPRNKNNSMTTTTTNAVLDLDNYEQEKKWRFWVNDHLVDILTLNACRTISEAVEASSYETGEYLIFKYCMSVAMYFGCKILRRKYYMNVTDERVLLYEAAEAWVQALKGRPFLGGSDPNLADLSVFAALRTIWPLKSGKDMVENTHIGDWYARMESAVGECAGFKCTMLPVQATVFPPPCGDHEKTIFPSSTFKQVELYRSHQNCPSCNKIQVFLDYYKIPYKIVPLLDFIDIEPGDLYDPKKAPFLKVDGERVVATCTDMMIDQLFQRINNNNNNNVGVLDNNGQEEGENKWRLWVDSHLVHVVNVNMHRTLWEAVVTSGYITRGYEWKHYYSRVGRFIWKHIIAGEMYVEAKRLKEKLNINVTTTTKTDERAALYEAAETWVEALRGWPFLGGYAPNLADLSVFALLRTIRPLKSGKDMVKNTHIGEWYARMEGAVGKSTGSETT